MHYDVVIVGAGPSGLAAAIRLKQLAGNAGRDLGVCVLEKGSQIGAHILSGAILETRALDELLPDWRSRGAPLLTPVSDDQFYFCINPLRALRVPNFLVPSSMHNNGNYVASLGKVCRWLGEQAEALQVDVFPGFAAAEIFYNDDGSVGGVVTGAMGVGRNGQPKDTFEPGMALHAKYTLFAEGSRGHLGKQLIQKFALDSDTMPQHYAIGIKELWEIDPTRHRPGLVVHSAGWPLRENGASGGGFVYHLADNQVALGLITDLNYRNPYLSPFDEFQRWKHHPLVKGHIAGGRRVAYGARSITKGGYYALPKMTVPGALLVGCDAGTLNFAKVKGTHTAMKSGMLAAEVVFDALKNDDTGSQDLTAYAARFQASWINRELYAARNFGPALQRWGTYRGGVFNLLEQNLVRAKWPLTVKDHRTDHSQLKPANECGPIDYPKPDGVISFDKLSSVYLSNTHHEEDQPCHLRLVDPQVAIDINLSHYDAPEQRYCPAAVYEIVRETDTAPRLQINAQNCVHCKTCDIKDLTQNIDWVPPEGGGGPNYPGM